MSEPGLVREKARRLLQTAAALRSCLPADPARLAADRDSLDLVSFRVYLAIQEAIDLASHLIAESGWGPAPSLRDHFTILERQGVIDGSLASPLAAGVKVRNLIGHAYADVDPVKLHEAASHLLALLEPYCSAILAFCERESR